MAVTLSINTEQVDNGEVLQITDDTSDYGSGNNMSITDIGSVYLKVEKSDLAGSYDSYGDVTFTHAVTAQSELYYELDCTTNSGYLTMNDPNMNDSPQSLGTVYSGTVLEDGIWRITYKTFHETSVNITKFEDYSGTVTDTVKVTAAGHGIETNDYVTIAGTTNYNGMFLATKIDVDTYYITTTWVSDDATGTSTETGYNRFLIFTNYEDKLAIYDIGRALPNKFLENTIEYNQDIEDFLLYYAFMKACEFAASVGQTEIIEDLQATLVDLYTTS